MKMIFRMKLAVPMLFLLCMLILNFGSAFADTESDDEFADMISSFSDKGLIPGTNGNYFSLGDYEGSIANMGYSAMTPLMEADHFVISGKLSWISAIMTPNAATSGCGFFFGASDETNEHLLISLRSDGYLYFSGYKNYTVLSYGKYPAAKPSYVGSGELCLIVDGDTVSVYLNGESFLQRGGMALSGNVLGLAILSGTYQDYGTRCNFEDLHVYTWE